MLVFAVPLSLRPICSSDRLESLPYPPSTVYCPPSTRRSAVHIRLFVPHSLTVCFPTGWKACPTAVRRPRSLFPIR
jgi:hypothetical protein